MKNKAVFDICPDGEFFGRAVEINDIFERATEVHKPAPNIYLQAPRWMGKTEVLRRVYLKLFWAQASVVPVYYRFKGTQGAPGFAEDFLKEVVRQALAFRLRDPDLARVEVSLKRLGRLVEDYAEGGRGEGGLGPELASILMRHKEARAGGDLSAELRNAVGAPGALSRSSATPVFLLLDDLSSAPEISSAPDAPDVYGELAGALGSGGFSFIASTRPGGPSAGGTVNGYIETMELKGLSEDDSVALLLELARQYHIGTDSEVLLQAARRLDGNPMYLKNIAWSAHRAGRDIASLRDLADLYATELVVGNTGFALRGAISLRGLNDLRVLHACSMAPGSTSDEELAERFGFGAGELREMLAGFAAQGLVTDTLGSIRWAGDGVMKDFIHYLNETRLAGKSPEEVRTRLVRDILKEGFSRRGEEVRGRFKEEVTRIAASFDGAKVRREVLDNSSFEAASGAAARPGTPVELKLPHIVGCFDAGRWEAGESGAPIVIANGFQNDRYDAGNEVVWLICVKEAITPANVGDVENFIRRAAFLRENFRSTRVVRWMVAREGFTEEAAARLSMEGIYSSDPVQLGVLRGSIRVEPETRGRKDAAAPGLSPDKEFEVVLPGGAKSELVAARAAEEIGSDMGFDDNSIGQIRAALVEACINAFEHSRSRTAKVHLKFIASPERLTINVQNGGAEFDASGVTGPGSVPARATQKRGWGIELMKGLMDEVRFERLAEGTRIVLVKYLKAKRSVKG